MYKPFCENALNQMRFYLRHIGSSRFALEQSQRESTPESGASHTESSVTIVQSLGGGTKRRWAAEEPK